MLAQNPGPQAIEAVDLPLLSLGPPLRRGYGARSLKKPPGPSDVAGNIPNKSPSGQTIR